MLVKVFNAGREWDDLKCHVVFYLLGKCFLQAGAPPTTGRLRLVASRSTGELSPRFWPESKFPVAGEDHQSNFLSFGNDLIVGLKLKVRV